MIIGEKYLLYCFLSYLLVQCGNNKASGLKRKPGREEESRTESMEGAGRGPKNGAWAIAKLRARSEQGAGSKMGAREKNKAIVSSVGTFYFLI